MMIVLVTATIPSTPELTPNVGHPQSLVHTTDLINVGWARYLGPPPSAQVMAPDYREKAPDHSSTGAVPPSTHFLIYQHLLKAIDRIFFQLLPLRNSFFLGFIEIS
ncbi:hypothetical protein TNIN_30221 [Trichonephila inaurata madagascariensis]|uniref:Uncharacterized protein n=1 Tax=Trichonephila inaurata madagascariensis TaxID=2747483 RepID=A0A8X6XCY7_9ARAC|nr:hypothetical protein TNIN_30221 [Trichonephila inaurata madagascariensis]